MNKILSTIILLAAIPIFGSTAAAFSCDEGTSLNDPECRITGSQDITGDEVTDSDTDIIVESGGRLYTDHKKPGNSPTAKIDLTNGDFIVEPGGAVHANINISAKNIKIEEGGVIDASGLGYQGALDSDESNDGQNCKFGSKTSNAGNKLCLGAGPRGGVSGPDNSGTGAGGGGHAGKGGSYSDGGNDPPNYIATGGGYGNVNDGEYGSSEDPSTFGSGGGSHGGTKTIQNVDQSFQGHNPASGRGLNENDPKLFDDSSNPSYNRNKTIKEATRFDYFGVYKDDPNNNLLDSDYWISTNKEYRASNSNDIVLGSGGGVLKLAASNKLNNSGSIVSNGLDGSKQDANGLSGGGGAGGSIFITAGGIYGEGTVSADGGSYHERLDEQFDAFSGGGGGGYIYYDYSINKMSWEVSADEGSGTSGIIGKNFGSGENTNGRPEEIATNGSIMSDIAFSVNVNDTIVNPDDPIKVNGTGSTTVNISINGTLVESIEQGSGNSFYNATVKSLDINDTENLGNYSMTVESSISENTITREFNISHRELEINQDSNYFFKPSEGFNPTGSVKLTKEDGVGGSVTEGYSGQLEVKTYEDDGSVVDNRGVSTDGSGNFDFSSSITANKGKKFYEAEAETDEGIRDADSNQLGWVTVNDSVVNPGETIKVNGTAYNEVEISLNGETTFLTPDPGNNYFEQVSTAPEKEGNYTVNVTTQLNGVGMTRSFDLNVRSIEFTLNSNYPRDVNPGVNLGLSGEAKKIGEKPTGYSKDLNITYFSEQEGTIVTKPVEPNSDGSFSSSQFNSQLKAGDRVLEIKSTNDDNIKARRNDSISTRIRLENVSSTSPEKRLFPDSTIDQTPYINPDQNVTINASTRTSLNSIKNVTAHITTPSGEKKKVELNNQSLTDEKLKWSNEKSISNFFSAQYGNYSLNYSTYDDNGNREDTNEEKSFFVYRNLTISPTHDRKINDSEQLNISGTSMLTVGDETGGPSKQGFNGNLNILYYNHSQESDKFSTVENANHNLPVGGNKPPIGWAGKDPTVTFIGRFSGIEESNQWNNRTDWDSPLSRSGLVHQDISDGIRSADKITLGYRKDNTGLGLEHYYSLDSDSEPLIDSKSSENFESYGSVNLGSPGITSSTSAEFNDGALRKSEQIVNGSEFTTNIWLKPEEIPSESEDPAVIIDSPQILDIQLVKNDELYVSLNTTEDNYSLETQSNAISTGTWQMVTVKYNGSELEIFKDGSPVTSAPANGNIETKGSPTSVGRGEMDQTSHYYNGSIDELRVYNSSLSENNISNIYNYAKEGEQTAGKKFFSEKVRPESLILNGVNANTNDRKLNLRLKSDTNGDGSFEETSDTVELENGKSEYSVSGLSENTSEIALRIEMEGNITHSPVLRSLNVSRRLSTKNPGLDITPPEGHDANVSGRLMEGERETRKLPELAASDNNLLLLSADKSEFDIRVNYTEIYTNITKQNVNVENGGFSTNFTMPEGAREREITYYTTTENGIFGINNSFATTQIEFVDTNVEDNRTGDLFVDVNGSLEASASLGKTFNPIEFVRADIDSQSKQFDLSGSGRDYSSVIPISEITDETGNYNISFKAKDTEGIREGFSPQEEIKIRNGSITINQSEETIGVERNFTVNGTVLHNSTDEAYDTTVNVSIPQNNYSNVTETNGSGFYSVELVSPSEIDNHTIVVESNDTKGITGEKTGEIEVAVEGDVQIDVPEKITATGVHLDSGINKTYELDIKNTGDTEIRGVKIYHKGLPFVGNEYPRLLEDEGATDWKSLNKTYDIPAGETRTVEGEIWIKEASKAGTYRNIKPAFIFDKSSGETRTGNGRFDVEVEANQRPLWQENNSVTANEGFNGNILPDGVNNTIFNQGSGTAETVTWKIWNDRFGAWTERFTPKQEPSERQIAGTDLSPGQTLTLLDYFVNIPEGTPADNYTTKIGSDSDSPDLTNNKTITVEIPSKPTYKLNLTKIKDGVKIPDEEKISKSNPIDVGKLNVGNSGKLFKIELKNTGNEDLKWFLDSTASTGDDKDIFSINSSGKNSETATSAIELENQENYTYDIPNKSVPTYYSIPSDETGGTYKANIIISCTPIDDTRNCEDQTVQLPIKAEIDDPAPYFENLSVEPSVQVIDKKVDLEADVLDNDQGYIFSEEPVNFTLLKDLNDTVSRTNLGANLKEGTTSTFISNYTADESLSQGPDWYGVKVEARDSSGQKNISKQVEFKVRKKVDPKLTTDNDTLAYNKVTSESSQQKRITGSIAGGDFAADKVNLTISTNSTKAENSFNIGGRFERYGKIDPEETVTFDKTVTAKSGTDPSVYQLNLVLKWENPDGEKEKKTADVNLDVNSTKKIRGNHPDPDRIEIDHNSTKRDSFTVESFGNDEATGIDFNFNCTDCDEDVSFDFNASDVRLGSGEEVTIQSNVTIAEYVPTGPIYGNMEVDYDSGTESLEQLEIFVKRQQAVSVEPDNQSSSLQIDTGVERLGTLSTKNIGNENIDIEFDDNDSSSSSNELFLDEKSTPYGTTIQPSNNDSVAIKFDSDSEAVSTGTYKYFVEPKLGSGSLDKKEILNLTVTVEDYNLLINNVSKKKKIKEGENLTASFNVTEGEEVINDDVSIDLRISSNGSEFGIPEYYNDSTKKWESSFNAPDLPDGENHNYSFLADSPSFEVTLENSTNVSYLDVSAPTVVTASADSVFSGNKSNMSATLKDDSNVTDVSAKITAPSGSTETESFTKNGSNSFETQFNKTTEKGLYTVNFTATDELDNAGSFIRYMRVYEPINVNGTAVNPVDSTEIELLNPDGEVSERIEPTEQDEYNETIKTGNFDVRIKPDENTTAFVEDFQGKKVAESPPKFDSVLEPKTVNPEGRLLTGFGLNSENFKQINGRISVDYSGFRDNISFVGNLVIQKCENYNVSDGDGNCISGFEEAGTVVDRSSDLAYTNISSFSAYVLTEKSSSDNTLSVELEENLSDLDLGSLLEQAASSSGSSGGGGGGGGGGSGGSGGGGSPSGFGDLVDQLNNSESQLAIGNNRLSVSLEPGEKKSTAVSVQNPRSEAVEIDITPTGNIEPLISLNSSVELQPGEFRTVRIEVDAENESELRQISGFLRVEGEEQERSIPFNIEIVSSENRLLDVSVEPTVESFEPGEAARLKLSFSNQGFSRAVDAETTIEIEDIVENETIARTTDTFAVQTTLDRVVELQIPESADIGTYEARADVEYSNVPGNRSATAVNQVDIRRPFLERKTLYLTNQTWFIIIFLLIAGGSGGGYWYYRKKKLEAKRKRFEEQVDNDAIPSDTGRSAFVGELSEIGTRSFINLDDLMTHCLTAGATGAGKSVAAQVIVEEALEQGVNVIVLDPTGQWSGYLDENENDEFFAFYSDFGMKEGDARSYEGNIRAVDADQDTIDITDIMRPEGDEGSIHVFSMHKLENAELEEYLSDTIQQIFDYNPEEKDSLKTLICYDEAHRVLPKFGGTGRGVKMLERGAREFRKWGTGMLMISQVIEDFPEEVRANIGTQIQMRTEYEGDLDRIERKYGNNITQGVTKADTGTGMLQNSSYNHGRPYFVDFRPVKHSPERLSDEELDKFEKYNRRVDELEDMISILKSQDEDVFEYESQLKLVKKNIRKRSFNLVDTYLDELEEDLNDALDI
ncbi:MAG: hypothetical protein BRC29_05410 [Nanohaloarchaea archaeon SW_7_43_1]|nr:MAG: hypothetical protein BRC29_05410 [Nanohaloarchaea archaeon SW_7_43_1]